MKKLSLFVAATLCSTVCLPTVKAQDLGGVFDMGQLAQGLTISATAHAHAARISGHSKGKRSRGGRSVGGSGSHPASGSGAVSGSTRFRVDLAARQRTLASLVTTARATDSQGAAALQRDFAKGDPIAAITPGLARYGLRTDDVADAATAYLVSAWYGVRGSNQDPARASLRATREQMHRALLSTPAFVSASNAAKQQLSDALLLQLMVTDRLITSAKGNPAQMARAKLSIRQNALKTFKLDLTKLKLTRQGLRA